MVTWEGLECRAKGDSMVSDIPGSLNKGYGLVVTPIAMLVFSGFS